MTMKKKTGQNKSKKMNKNTNRNKKKIKEMNREDEKKAKKKEKKKENGTKMMKTKWMKRMRKSRNEITQKNGEE